MTFFELFLIGIGLSMDAFAVSICKGLSMQKIDKKDNLMSTNTLRFFMRACGM